MSVKVVLNRQVESRPSFCHFYILTHRPVVTRRAIGNHISHWAYRYPTYTLYKLHITVKSLSTASK